jgi:catechol 2,3-dioxygenase-like lactoylglutathione lyase family enzyme
LTAGKYDDFDARYLPDGRIVFLSTRRGQAVQVRQQNAARTLSVKDLPDCYVRCGGGPERPVAVYTLHTMNADGSDLRAISPFEMFEWTPSVAHDGTILYSQWDYVDRTNHAYMSLWSMNPDGTNARLVYKNYTPAPHCTFEPQCVPDSHKIIFTASAHHAQTMGSLVLLDPTVGTEGAAPITRLTPEVCFPEAEGWPTTFFAGPWPLSQRFCLVTWGREENVSQGRIRPTNGMGLYLFDAAGDLELLHRDPDITSESPVPIRPRPRPPVLIDRTYPDGPLEGRFLVSDVTHGLKTLKRGEVKALRIVAVPPKTHPTMNLPNLGLTAEDPGKCVLGTVPVEADGSAYFRVPAGVIFFFQALDARGIAVQTMRGATHVQPGQTLSCIGCHEHRGQAPPPKRSAAFARAPSRITVGPEGSWPLRFDRLVQPVLERHCVRCHNPKSDDPRSARFDLTAAKAYGSLTGYGKPSLAEHALARNRQGFSVEGAGAAATSPLLARLTDPKGHYDLKLDAEGLERLLTWMDTYAQRLGSFSEEQERELLELRRRHADLLIERRVQTAESSILR